MDEVDESLANQLRDIVKRHQGTLVETEDDATHIIYRIPESAKADGAADYLRPVMRRDRNALVHWWYCPDSYDTWVSDFSLEIDIDDKYEPDGAWEVRQPIISLQVCLVNSLHGRCLC